MAEASRLIRFGASLDRIAECDRRESTRSERERIGASAPADAETLLLAVEVLSPSTARADRFTKRRLYQEVGVPCYWIVDPDAQCAEVWTPDAVFPTVERERVTWRPAGVVTPFELGLSALFREV